MYFFSMKLIYFSYKFTIPDCVAPMRRTGDTVSRQYDPGDNMTLDM